MAAATTTSTTELGDSRVRVSVEVASREVERELEAAARTFARDLKIPGFRKGKVPTAVVLQRIGREAVLDEALRRALPTWYEEALREARIAAIGEPKLDLDGLPAKGAPLIFSIEVAVRPAAVVGQYKGLEVGRREPEVSPAEIDAAIERLRDSLASLETVARPAVAGDFVVVDFTGLVEDEPFEGGEARGYLLELGSGQLIESFEEQLVGLSAGEQREVCVNFPADYAAEQVAGREAVFATTVKEVKEKRLPAIDDDLAIEAGGYDSVSELRAEVESKLRAAREEEVEQEFREAVVDAAAAAATIELPGPIVHAKAHEMWEQTARRLKRQGVDPELYLSATGKSEEELITEAEPDAERALRRESVLAAIVEAEAIEASDEEMLDALRAASKSADQPAPSEQDLRTSLDRAKAEGRDDPLREDVTMRKALDTLVAAAKPIPLERAQARDKLWTPEKEGDQPPERLWTPGSGEPAS